MDLRPSGSVYGARLAYYEVLGQQGFLFHLSIIDTRSQGVDAHGFVLIGFCIFVKLHTLA